MINPPSTNHSVESLLNDWVEIEDNPSAKEARNKTRDLIMKAGVSLESNGNLSVNGHLNLKGIEELTQLPHSLVSVNGDLSLRNCPNLLSLKNISVNGNLDVKDCINLTTMTNVSVDGYVITSGCRKLDYSSLSKELQRSIAGVME